jgi:hypothetical protein
MEFRFEELGLQLHTMLMRYVGHAEGEMVGINIDDNGWTYDILLILKNPKLEEVLIVFGVRLLHEGELYLA